MSTLPTTELGSVATAASFGATTADVRLLVAARRRDTGDVLAGGQVLTGLAGAVAQALSITEATDVAADELVTAPADTALHATWDGADNQWRWRLYNAATGVQMAGGATSSRAATLPGLATGSYVLWVNQIEGSEFSCVRIVTSGATWVGDAAVHADAAPGAALWAIADGAASPVAIDARVRVVAAVRALPGQTWLGGLMATGSGPRPCVAVLGASAVPSDAVWVLAKIEIISNLTSPINSIRTLNGEVYALSEDALWRYDAAVGGALVEQLTPGGWSLTADAHGLHWVTAAGRIAWWSGSGSPVLRGGVARAGGSALANRGMLWSIAEGEGIQYLQADSTAYAAWPLADRDTTVLASAGPDLLLLGTKPDGMPTASRLRRTTLAFGLDLPYGVSRAETVVTAEGSAESVLLVGRRYGEISVGVGRIIAGTTGQAILQAEYTPCVNLRKPGTFEVYREKFDETARLTSSQQTGWAAAYTGETVTVPATAEAGRYILTIRGSGSQNCKHVEFEVLPAGGNGWQPGWHVAETDPAPGPEPPTVPGPGPVPGEGQKVVLLRYPGLGATLAGPARVLWVQDTHDPAGLQALCDAGEAGIWLNVDEELTLSGTVPLTADDLATLARCTIPLRHARENWLARPAEVCLNVVVLVPDGTRLQPFVEVVR